MKNTPQWSDKRQRTSKILRRLVMIYLAGILLVFFVMSWIALHKMRPAHMEVVNLYIDTYSKGEIIQIVVPSEIVMVYDEAGKLLQEYAANGRDVATVYKDIAATYLSRILTEGVLYTPVLTQGDNAVMLLTASSIILDGGGTGALIMMVAPVGLIEDFFFFFCIFTLIFGMVAADTIYFLKRQFSMEELRRTYIANISHNLKSPIVAIRVLTEAMHDGLVQDAESQQRYFEIILTETGRQERAIKDLLELSKIQSFQVDFSKSAVAAHLIFDQICDTYRVLYEEKGIQLDVSETISTLPKLYTNTDEVIRLLEILLDNAAKFVGENGRICLDASNQNKRIVICVRDNGIGISKEALPHIFERFYKVNSAYNSTGNGLGLAIARTIADSLGEELWVESEPGKGTEFYFSIQTA